MSRAILATLVAGLFSAPAFAAPSTYYSPGTDCQLDYETAALHKAGGTYNSSSSARTINCPVLTYWMPVNTYIQVNDATTTGYSACQLCYTSYGATSTTCGAVSYTSSTLAGPQWLSLAKYASWSSTTTYGAFYMSCTLPAASGTDYFGVTQFMYQPN